MTPPPLPLTEDPAARRRAWLILLGLTAAGGLLRFAWLGRPCLWGDEALVYWRTCGSFAQMLTPLHTDGFPPLHYELYWLIGRWLGHVPGPAVMRTPPTVCGMLTVPAVYGLARQLLPRRASLLAAAFTAGSGFALFYSRDCKMYAEAWLCLTVGVAALLAWVRTGRPTAWLAWIAAGAAAGGLQTLALVGVVGLSPLVLLTQRRAHSRQLLPWLAGVGLIVAGPVGYYARFNGWAEQIDARGRPATGLEWVAAYNYGRTGPDLGQYLATTFLTGWEWPRPAGFAQMPPWRGRLLRGMAVAVAVVLLAAALPWPAGRGSPIEPGPEPPWRAALWLGAWVALPVYGFYCRSMPGFALPLDAVPLHAWAWGLVMAVAAAAAVAWRPTRPTAAAWLSVAAALAAVAVACQGVGVTMAAMARAAAAAERPWQSVWVPRYLGFAWPAVAVGVGGLLARLPTRAVRWSAVGLVLAANVGMGLFRVLGSTEPPVDRMAADVVAAQPTPAGPADTVTFTALQRPRGGPGTGNLWGEPGWYYLQVFARRPMTPDRFQRSLSTFTLHNFDPGDVPDLAAVGPAARRVVVWEQFDTDDRPDADDDLLPRLPGWRRTADQGCLVRDPWTAQDLSRYRRREYARNRSAAAPPGTNLMPSDGRP